MQVIDVEPKLSVERVKKMGKTSGSISLTLLLSSSRGVSFDCKSVQPRGFSRIQAWPYRHPWTSATAEEHGIHEHIPYDEPRGHSHPSYKQLWHMGALAEISTSNQEKKKKSLSNSEVLFN